MQLPYHDRYAYSPIVDRPHYSWPDGKRLAVYLGLNIEHFAFGAGEGHLLSVAGAAPDPRTFAWRDYGNRVGVWRCLELFDELNLPAAHLINTAVFDYAPRIVDALKARGDEFIGHGRTNAERHSHMWEADERRFLQEVRDAIERASGKPPRGWMAPWMASTHHTPDLLKEVGFDFLMDWPADDQPLWMKTRSGPIMSVPYPIEINDSPQILVRHHSPEEFRDFIIGQFEELLRQSANQPLVCGIALHTMIVGQPYRLRMLREALRHIVSHPEKEKVWFTRPSAIYDHCAALPAGKFPPA
jgi:peptidoglycan/xylan/chitin deacetylase (PgdA/CDA1 family)